MARHYSTKDFFWQIPNALLKRYFSDKGLMGVVDFALLPESKPDILFGLWLNLAESQRKSMDTEFRDIVEWHPKLSHFEENLHPNLSHPNRLTCLIFEQGWARSDQRGNFEQITQTCPSRQGLHPTS